MKRFQSAIRTSGEFGATMASRDTEPQPTHIEVVISFAKEFT
jgi:hypothetical protein